MRISALQRPKVTLESTFAANWRRLGRMTQGDQKRRVTRQRKQPEGGDDSEASTNTSLNAGLGRTQAVTDRRRCSGSRADY